MTSVKDAFEVAKTFLEKEVYPQEPDLDVSLEEVEISDDERYWYITLGFTRKNIPSASTLGMLARGLNPHRTFKVFKVDTTSNAVKSMKIRQ